MMSANHMPPVLDRRRNAFTLLEAVLAITILIVLMATMFAFYNNSLRVQAEGAKISRESQLARVVINRIATEIRQAVGTATGYGTGIDGAKHDLTIRTVVTTERELWQKRSVREKELPAQHDLREINYYIAWHEEITNEEGIPLALGLVRREVKTMGQLTIIEGKDDVAEDEDEEESQSIKIEMYAPEIKYIEFGYFDGGGWTDEWTMPLLGNSLPQIVRITVGYETRDPEDEELDVVEDDFLKEEAENFIPPGHSLTTYVRIAQADEYFGSRMTRAAFQMGDFGG